MFRRAISNPFLVKSINSSLTKNVFIDYSLQKRKFSIKEIIEQKIIDKKPLNKEDINVVVPKKYLEELEKKVNSVYNDQQIKKQEEENAKKEVEEYLGSAGYYLGILGTILSNGFICIASNVGAHGNPLAVLGAVGFGLMGFIPDKKLQIASIVIPWIFMILLSN